MEHRNLGRSGLRVSVVGLGCNNFGGRTDPAQSRTVIHRALDAGITLLDTADVYGGRGRSEEIIGEALGERRREIVLATKFGMPMRDGARPANASRAYIIEAAEASLRRLRTDWIDLYQVHRPDPETPVEETLRALDDLITAGKVRYAGVSNFPAWLTVEAQMTARQRGLAPLVSSQDEFSLFERGAAKTIFPALRAHGLGFLPFFPLAGGLLSGKYREGAPLPEGARLTNRSGGASRFLTEANLAVVERLVSFAEARGHTLLELAFGWLLSQAPVTSVIAGATRPEQIDANVGAADWRLTAAEMAEVEGIVSGGE
jgi:aryl-alcohol dehydrogenase-like predicted oxidoreductase